MPSPRRLSLAFLALLGVWLSTVYVSRVTERTDRMVACVAERERDQILTHEAAVRSCAVAR